MRKPLFAQGERVLITVSGYKGKQMAIVESVYSEPNQAGRPQYIVALKKSGTRHYHQDELDIDHA